MERLTIASGAAVSASAFDSGMATHAGLPERFSNSLRLLIAIIESMAVSRNESPMLRLVIRSIFVAFVCTSLVACGGGSSQSATEKRAALLRESQLLSADARVLVTPITVGVREPVTWELKFELRELQMSVGGGIKVRFAKGFFPHAPQSAEPGAPGYVSATTSSSSARVAVTQVSQTDAAVDWDMDRNAYVVTVLVLDAPLEMGESITLTYGSDPPIDAAPAAAYSDQIFIACDRLGKGVYTELRQRPRVKSVPRSASYLAGYMPSTAVVGEPVTATIMAMDRFENLAVDYAGTLQISSTGPEATIPGVVEVGEGDGGGTSIEATFSQPGVATITAVDARAGWTAVTNPIWITEQPPESRIYWGDLHSHTNVSYDGIGTGSFDYARDVARLDFYAVTDHTSGQERFGHGGINPDEWTRQKRLTAAYNEEGRFVTLPGYEFSANFPSGHHNLIFNVSDADIDKVPLLRDDRYRQVQNLWVQRMPEGVEFIAIPHHTGLIWDRDVGTGPWVTFGKGWGHEDRRRLIEIYSHHGQSEAYDPQRPLSYSQLGQRNRGDADGPHYAQDAWALGEMLGVISSTDNHSSQPGSNQRGLAAVYARELSRDGIFEGLKHRQTYGTTGQRILLDFRINGAPMGSQITLESGQSVAIDLFIHGTDTLEYVELLRWAGGYANGHPTFLPIQRLENVGQSLQTAFVDAGFSGQAVYYVRVKQLHDREGRPVFAWSSPIAVKLEE